jgi:carboxyl-terminal processing protease
VPIDNSTALKLTTARYYTPSGRSIQAQGIEPDITLVRGELSLAEESEIEPLKEANLSRHLDDATEGKGTRTNDEKNAKEDEGGNAESEREPAEDKLSEKKPLAIEDYQLGEALNVLKGLNILGRARGG